MSGHGDDHWRWRVMPGYLWRSGEIMAEGEGDRLRPTVDIELAVEVLYMALDRAHAEGERVGDLGIALARGDQPQHLGFPCRKTEGGGNGWLRAAGQALVEACDAGEGWLCPERRADGMCFDEQPPRSGTVAGDGMEFCQCEQGTCPLVGCGAGIGEGERRLKVLGCRGESPGIGRQFAQQAVGCEQHEWLARSGCLGQRLLGVLQRRCGLIERAMILRPGDPPVRPSPAYLVARPRDWRA
jgi:hypothetical protein